MADLNAVARWWLDGVVYQVFAGCQVYEMEQKSVADTLRELVAAYAWEAQARFRRKLRLPILALTDTTTRLGQWVRAPRRLELSRTLVVARPWPEVLSVLLHEMAHQYVDEVLQIRDEPAHGPVFRRVCQERGIAARASGAPGPARAACR